MKKIYLETPEAVIKALKEGKEVRTELWERTLKLVEGIIVQIPCENNPNIHVGGGLAMNDKPYILEEAPFEVQVGEWYKTRGNEKARFFKKDKDYLYFTIDGRCSFYTLHTGYFYGKEAPNNLDIIGPWKGDKLSL